MMMLSLLHSSMHRVHAGCVMDSTQHNRGIHAADDSIHAARNPGRTARNGLIIFAMGYWR
jgi:hypothetical protein